MNILAIDTATEACSVAVQFGEEVAHAFSVSPQQHSQLIIERVDALLQAAKKPLQAVDVLAFTRGPGSFTGVRIATGVIQGLAMATEKPVVAMSTLATMAQEAYTTARHQRVIAAIDARMGEVYFGIFEADPGGVMQPIGAEAVLAPLAARQRVDEYIAQQGRVALVGTGWQNYAEPLLQGLATAAASSGVGVVNAANIEILYPNALHMLPLAMAAVRARQTLRAEQVEPVYLRDTVTWKKLPGRD